MTYRDGILPPESFLTCYLAFNWPHFSVKGQITRREPRNEASNRLSKVKCRSVMLGSNTGDLSPEEWREQFGIGLAQA